MEQVFEILEHPSDLGIRAYGNSLEDVFRNVVFGFMSIVAGTSKIDHRENRRIEISAANREQLLVRWLTEILFLYDAEKFLTAQIQFEYLNTEELQAVVSGELFDSSKHEFKLDVKAVTYHHLKIEEQQGHWIASVYLDI